ncbi:hypothetical protein [uncultured Methylobacterium sp.]|uniref:hypothetical protein n=1 Tax=uncultured Methylobacterium sp. TaxID=157278 RepID=UPI0035CA7700
MPAKYILKYIRKRDEFVGDVRGEHSYGLLREVYAFCLVDILASRLNKNIMGIAPNEFFEFWKRFRLADGYSYFLDLLSSKGDRDELRKQFEAAKVEVDTAEFVEWLEGLGR